MSPIFFFNDTATTEIYTLSLHDALPISATERIRPLIDRVDVLYSTLYSHAPGQNATWRSSAENMIARSEEHTSELQSRLHLVCRLLLEKKKKKNSNTHL